MTANYQLHLGDCLEIMPQLADNSIDLILTDPPYFKVKGEAWDRQWSDRGAFLSWLGKVADEWKRALKPNGSLYCFASPQMSWHVEGLIRERFCVLNVIQWVKPDPSLDINYGASGGGRMSKAAMRSFWPTTEKIIFAEHYGADNIAKGEAGYAAKCDELRGFVFEPLRAYLDGERRRSGVGDKQLRAYMGLSVKGGGLLCHFWNRAQWMLPTEEHYLKMREGMSRLNHGGAYLQRPYEELRQEYEDLRQEYEEIRRPFNATPDTPYTDVWTFPTVSHYAGKHPCEKPLALLEHAIKISSREGATVLDCFMGGGSTGHACRNTNRNFIGIEKDADYFATAKRRIENAQPALLEAN